MPTTHEAVTDARSLYDVSSEFRAFLRCWDDDRRCPLPLVDFLLEQGLERQAEACRWAATEPDREVYMPVKSRHERDGECGPYPSMFYVSSTEPVYWAWLSGDHLRASCVPERLLSNWGYNGQPSESAIDAIVWLLDNWRLDVSP